MFMASLQKHCRSFRKSCLKPCQRPDGTLFRISAKTEVSKVSLLSRLRAVVSGDDYLDGYDDELDYDQGDVPETSGTTRPGSLALSSDFDSVDPFAGSNVIGMPGISSAAAEVTLMEPAWGREGYGASVG